MFNYVLLGVKNDYNLVPFNDILTLRNVEYHRDIKLTKKKFLNLIYKLHVSPSSPLSLLPLKGVWDNLIFSNNFIEKKPLCFIYLKPALAFAKNGFVDSIKARYADSRHVALFLDVDNFRKTDIRSIKKCMDLALIFDPAEAKRCNIGYYPLFYSAIKTGVTESFIESDICFVGKAKDRLEEIASIYEHLRKAGVRCSFYISGNVPKEKQRHSGGIHYIDQMSYLENLRILRSSKCVLDLKQNNVSTYSLRTCEAVCYGRRILTNNDSVMKAPFYHDGLVSFFKKPSDIDVNFLKSDFNVGEYGYSDKMSPRELLNYLEEYFFG